MKQMNVDAKEKLRLAIIDLEHNFYNEQSIFNGFMVILYKLRLTGENLYIITDLQKFLTKFSMNKIYDK